MLSSALICPALLIINAPNDASGGDPIPGNSSAIYRNNPTNNLFQIDRLDMISNPPSYYRDNFMKAFGSFKEDLTNPQALINVTVWGPEGEEKAVAVFKGDQRRNRGKASLRVKFH